VCLRLIKRNERKLQQMLNMHINYLWPPQILTSALSYVFHVDDKRHGNMRNVHKQLGQFPSFESGEHEFMKLTIFLVNDESTPISCILNIGITLVVYL